MEDDENDTIVLVGRSGTRRPPFRSALLPGLVAILTAFRIAQPATSPTQPVHGSLPGFSRPGASIRRPSSQLNWAFRPVAAHRHSVRFPARLALEVPRPLGLAAGNSARRTGRIACRGSTPACGALAVIGFSATQDDGGSAAPLCSLRRGTRTAARRKEPRRA